MRTHGHGRTHLGLRRENNEDAFFADDALGCYIVCDGVGGHAGGEVASATAIEAATNVIRAQADVRARVAEDAEPPAALEEIAREAALAAAAAVHGTAAADARLTGMATTFTLLCTAGHFAALAHVGDSRCYLLRDGTASQISTDHTYAEELRTAGGWTDEQIAKSPFGSALSRAMGMEAVVHADTLSLELAAGDRFILCSDGLSRYLTTPADLAARVPDDTDAAAQALVDFANAAGGKDNVTVIVVEVGGDDTFAPSAATTVSDSAHRLTVLDGVPLFRGFRLGVRARILAACMRRAAAPGAVLWKAGEVRDSMLIVLEGRVELREAGGDRVEELGPGDSAGEDRLLHPAPARVEARAIGDVRWLEFSRDQLWALTRLRPRLGLVLSRRLGERAAARLQRWRERVHADARELWESLPLHARV